MPAHRSYLLLGVNGVGRLDFKATVLCLVFGNTAYLTSACGAHTDLASSSSLMLTANLKGAHIAQDLDLYQDLVQSVSTRTLLQEYLKTFSNGNTAQALLFQITTDLDSALSGGGRDALLLQAKIFPPSNATTAEVNGIVNVTGNGARGTITLPYNYANGSSIYLGDPGLGYPRELYPNFTYVGGPVGATRVQYNNRILDFNSTLILGPLYLSEADSALLSITVPINNNTSLSEILGWLTIVVDARLLYDVIATEEGLGQTGQVLIVGSPNLDNLFSQDVTQQSSAQNTNVPVWFVLPPQSNSTLGYRHNLRAYGTGNPDLPFMMGSYPSVLDAWSMSNTEVNNAGSYISTHNEEGKGVSTGYAQINSDLVDWVVVFEQSYGEVVHPIVQFRNIVLICVFSVVGAIIVVCVPIAHCAAIPIKRLQAATIKSIATYETEHSRSSDSLSKLDKERKIAVAHPSGGEGKGQTISSTTFVKPPTNYEQAQNRKRVFQIPEKVPDRRHLIKDELTDLTGTFNEMSDELRVQYARLEERVRARTVELEHSRNIARAASESKTLFIANISHELRTPLNGIIGMCTIAISENSLRRVRQSLKIIYKSSDLLLHLLNDLITFSRNSYGQQLAIEDGFFRLTDIKSQLMSIFERQAKESKVELRVLYLSENSGQITSDALRKITSQGELSGPGGTGAMKDMSLRGDKNRILQILMNLMSNSLKFTPVNGAIELRIRCRGYADKNIYSRNSPDNGSPKITMNETGDGQQQDSNTTNTPDSADDKYLLFDFEVEDTGAGIPEDMQKEVFKPFVQGDAALSKKHGGTGLGLAICTQLASLMNGKVILKSTHGIGSTFTLSLPLRYTKEVVPSMPTSLAGSLRSSSKPNSILSFPRETDSRRVHTRDPSPAQRSVLSHGRTDSQQSEVPRVVGFSNPYIADSDSIYENEQTDRQGVSMRPLSQGASEIKGNSNDVDYEGLSTIKQQAERRRNVAQRSVSPTQRPGTPTKKPTPSKLSIINSNASSTHGKDTTQAAQTLRVLVAEDNKVNQEVIKRILRLEKVTDVTVAEDGQEALEMMQKAMNIDTELTKSPTFESQTPERRMSPPPFHVIFMDIQMPRMDGIDSTRKIREIGFEGPIVALTAYTDDTNREACMGAGMQAFLGKPIKRPALKEVLAKVRESSAGNNEDVWKN